MKTFLVFLFLLFSNPLSASTMIKVSSADLPSLSPEGDLEVFKAGLKAEIESCKNKSASQTLTFGSGNSARKVTIKEWCIETGEAFLKIAENAATFEGLWSQAREKFDWYRKAGDDGKGTTQFTGYFSPLLRGSRLPKKGMDYPMYAKPDDLVKVDGSWMMRTPTGKHVPYPDRKSIDMDQALKNKNLEIAYVSDIFEAYIFHVQGAGTVVLEEADGSQKRIFLNYTAENGRPYSSLRRILLDRGVDPQYCTIPGMKRYFAEHPELLLPTLAENQSYVFFREDEKGPLGATDTVLIPGHAVAVDRNHFPMSALSLVHTERPLLGEGNSVVGWQPFSRFALTQDVGGAIKGASRVDFFWGEGDYAETAAGVMNQNGQFFIAVVKKSAEKK